MVIILIRTREWLSKAI